MTSADVKKNKVTVPAALGLKSAGKDALIAFELPDPVASQSDKKSVFSGTPAKSKPSASGATPAKVSSKV